MAVREKPRRRLAKPRAFPRRGAAVKAGVRSSDVERLFAQAVDLYGMGKLAAAAALFRMVAAADGDLAVQARRYLARIAAKRPGAKPTVRPRKAASGAKTTKSATARRAGKPRTAPKAKPKAARPKRYTAQPKAEAPARPKVQRKARSGAAVEAPPPPPSRGRGPLLLGGPPLPPPPDGSGRRRSAPPSIGRLEGVAGKPLTTAAAAPPGTASEIVRRTPHVDIRPQTPLEPGAAFEVEVFVDQQAARAGEDSTDVAVPAGTHVQVHLIASGHFTIDGPTVQPMIIDAAPRSDAPPFHLTVKPVAELPAEGSPHISALFMHEGRPCGMVRRAVEIVGVAAPPSPPSPARFEAAPTKAADLHITVVAAEEKDGRTFTCIVHTPHLAAYHEPVAEPWTLADAAEKLVRAYMNEFTAKNATPPARIAALRGAGLQLFDASPKIFRKALWELIDAGVPVKDIAIVSEEPFIPWELMIPNRPKPGGGRERRKPLGLEFRIGRWTPRDMVKPGQKLTLTNSYVIAPDYADPRKKLQHAKDEATFVATAFDGETIAPARFADIERKLKGAGRTLVHFICHGLDAQSGIQTIELENNDQLTSTSVEGMDGIEDTFLAAKPIVFLNACEVGRPAPALVGLGGFAASFIRLGASAVIAPLWSVKDSIAHQIAMEFYKRVKEEPETPFAEILRKIRENAYDSANGEDTYAAYCFYGDPAAVAVRA